MSIPTVQPSSQASPQKGNLVAPTVAVQALEHPNMYVGMMLNEFRDVAFDEPRALALRGRWRELGFGRAAAAESGRIPMDLEIGTGNGFHFAHRAKTRPERLLVGLELKFKPLVQSIRRCVRAGCENARIARFDAHVVGDLFEPGEIDDVFIHFPDPWPKKRNWKNRTVNPEFLSRLHALQRPGSKVEFKTDSEAYFDWALERFPSAPYRVEFVTRDLHHSERAPLNFVTAFESLFLGQGLPIYCAILARD